MRGQLVNAAVDMAVEQAVNWLALVGERPAKRWCFSTPTRTDSSLPGRLGHCRTWRGGASLCGRVVVGVRVCRCVGSVYNVRLHARSRGENNGAEQTLQHASFFPPMEQNRSSRCGTSNFLVVPGTRMRGSARSLGSAMCCHILTRGRRCRRAALFKEGLGKPKACYTLSDVTLPEFRVI